MAKKPSFENQMERLQRVVAELEKGDTPLEKSVALYKEGQSLAASCRDMLEKARHEVTVHGNAGVTPFHDGEDMAPEEEA